MRMKLEWTRRALTDLNNLDRVVRRRVLDALNLLAETGRGDVQPLRVRGDESRLRVGDWRVILIRDRTNNIVHVRRVLHRSEAYLR